MKFQFTLKPIKEVALWGKAGHECLSWFGLTDGYYAIDAENTRLFQYTPSALRHFGHCVDASQPLADCVDYQIVRFYEDLLDILPDIMAPVSLSAHNLIHDLDAHIKWHEGLGWLHRTEIGPDPLLDRLYQDATEWIGYRKLDTGYLIDGPDIWFWRLDDEIHIRWNNFNKLIEGLPRWTASQGSCSLPYETFIAEVDDFHQRLMDEMDGRIRDIQENNPLPHVEIDLPHLIAEHKSRMQSLAEAKLLPPHPIDWDSVVSSNDRLRNWPDKTTCPRD